MQSLLTNANEVHSLNEIPIQCLPIQMPNSEKQKRVARGWGEVY